MRRCGLLLLLSVLSGCLQSPSASSLESTVVPDPYQWLESPVTRPRVSAWLTQQAQQVRHWQQQHQALYQATRERLRAAWDHPKWQVVDIIGEQVLFYYNSGLEPQYSLYLQSYQEFVGDRAQNAAPGDGARLLIDGNVFTDNTRPGEISISPDLQWLAFQINQQTRAGDWQIRWYLLSLTAASSEPRLLSVNHEGWTLPAEQLAWSEAGDTLLFAVSVPPAQRQSQAGKVSGADWHSRIYRIAVNNSPGAAEAVFIAADGQTIEQLRIIKPDAATQEHRAHDNHLLMQIAGVPGVDAKGVSSQSNATTLRWSRVDVGTGVATGLVQSGQDAGHFVAMVRGIPAFLTLGDRGTGAITLADEQRARTLVPESEAPLLSARRIGERLLLEYLVHGTSTLKMVDLDGRPIVGDWMPALPAPVRIDAIRAAGQHQALVSFSGIVTPPRSELVDWQSRQQTILTQDQPDLGVGDLQARLVFARADDDARVPVWLAGKADREGRYFGPMLLEVYGGFAAPMETSFSISRLQWMASGGSYAVAGPRGGGDYGEQWHAAGSGAYRNNSITDVLAVTASLRRERLAEQGGVAISGRSHGGLLAAEAVQRSPDAFAALLTDAALFDLKRLDALGGASFWQQEYRDGRSFPYQALLNGDPELKQHPPALLVVRDRDTVVAPAHSFKYLQALQTHHDKHSDAEPVTLLSVTPGQDHDASVRIDHLLDDYALRWTFLKSSLKPSLKPSLKTVPAAN
ncbi:hypothetical protein PHACT_15160 [Pseudohongiella acticola]|uniref:prolyl oligopeptidase n=1 Tax=Pseudohongiella acticola TaxID=1524254 RepID=A0A1E8CFF0_9GAMM|nr:prolyl oligopeptidase family serine peptidase [Pseudohongiella acticola]OFE11178.1 hypothetical protein PHACT_15160 [Pseudohongiella acticola]